MAFLNFKYGSQSGLPTTTAPGTVYITKDTKKLFVDNPTDGSTDRICLGDFQLVPWTKSDTVTSPAAELASHSLKDTNILYITVESSSEATAMWRYNGTTFVPISNSEEIADIVAEISTIKTSLNGKAPTNHAVNANTYGLGTAGVYGHVKLTDAINTTQANGQASKGIAASAYAVKLAYDRGTAGVNAAATAQAAAEAADAKAVAAQGTADAAVTAAEKAQGEVDTLEGVVAGKAPTDHASTATTYGAGSSTEYGHVKLSDATNVTSANGGAATGVAASAYAVKLAYDRGSKGVTDAASAATAASNAATAAANANTNAESRLPKASPIVSSGQLTLAVDTPTADKHAASKKYVDSVGADTLNSAKAYTNTRETAILGTDSDGTNYSGTVKGAYAAASSASSAASTAQDRADDAYELAESKTTTAEVKAQIENYGYATTTVAQNKADAALASAKSYTDGKISTVNTTINTLKSDIGNLSNIMNFLGTTTTEIADGTTATIAKPSAVTESTYTAKTGDVVVDSKGKECVYDGAKWRVIGDTSANSTAITALQNRMTTAESDIDNLQADVGTDDGKGALFTRVAALETWKGTHSTEYSNLNTTVGNHSTAIGASTDSANASGSLYARIKKNASDISGHTTRISALETWKTSHASEYTALAKRVTDLESWKGTHTTAYNTLNSTVSSNTTAINNLTTILTWGSF